LAGDPGAAPLGLERVLGMDDDPARRAAPPADHEVRASCQSSIGWPRPARPGAWRLNPLRWPGCCLIPGTLICRPHSAYLLAFALARRSWPTRYEPLRRLGQVALEEAEAELRAAALG
jgi:hypothetical protein